MQIIPVILSGGSGTRLWPLSRKQYPKQYLPLVGDNTMLKATMLIDKQAFESSPSDSIDYALMERSDNVVVISLDAQWNDIGSWSALHDIGIKDSNGNVIQGDVFTEDTTNTYIHANHHMVATIGVQDLVIVDTPNATLISTKDKSQEVKNIVEQLQRQDREE